MTDRPKTELDEMASRMAKFMNEWQRERKWLSGEINLRMVAEMCWAIGVTPDFEMVLTEKGDE